MQLTEMEEQVSKANSENATDSSKQKKGSIASTETPDHGSYT